MYGGNQGAFEEWDPNNDPQPQTSNPEIQIVEKKDDTATKKDKKKWGGSKKANPYKASPADSIYPFFVIRLFARSKATMIMLLMLISFLTIAGFIFSAMQYSYPSKEDDLDLCDDFDTLLLSPIYADYKNNGNVFAEFHCGWPTPSSVMHFSVLCLTFVICCCWSMFMIFRSSDYIQHPLYEVTRWCSLVLCVLWFVSFVLDTDQVKVGNGICEDGLKLDGQDIVFKADECDVAQFVLLLLVEFFLFLAMGIYWLSLALYKNTHKY